MTTITFPSNEHDIVNQIRSAVGRPVIFFSGYQSDCPACDIDPVTNTSTNVFCTVCSGVGYIVVWSGTTISGHITQGQTDHMQWVTGGEWLEGDCRVQIEYTPENLTIVDSADFVQIDGRKFDVRKKTLRGVKEINRILIDAIQRND